MTSLKFIALSGTTGVTENLYVYEYGNEMMILDCGIGFPDLEMQGVDLVIPDFSYIKANANKLKGILISQGHEDHQGALPFLLKDVKAPIYATEMVAAFITDKLRDYKVKEAQINVYDPDKDTVTIGPFKIHPFRVAHSIPDTLGFAIDTPQGRVFHVAEHKFDPTPVDGKPFDIAKAKELGSKDVLFLASDCLGSYKPGATPSEKDIEGKIENIMKVAPRAIFFTTISSNIGRIQQVINVAQRLSRKVAFAGRSIDKKAQIARELGILKYPDSAVVPLKVAASSPVNQVVYIIAGCYGQAGSSLFRVATDDHRFLKAEKDDMVVFSADPAPPYSKESIDFVVDNLIEQGLDVHYYLLNEGLYVSGHGSQNDIIRLFDLTKPKFFIPIGGTIRFMHGYRILAEKYGASPESIFELKPGEIVEFEGGRAKKTGRIKVKEILVDGLGVGDVGKVVLSDRKALGENGVAIAIIQLDVANKRLTGDPDIISRGFVFEKEEKGFLKHSAKNLRKRLERAKKLNARTARYITIEFLADLFYKETARRPMILPVVVEV